MAPARSAARARSWASSAELHPTVAASWDFDEPVAVLAIDLGKVRAPAPELATYQDLTTYPEMRQDLALTVGDDAPAARVLEVVRAAGGVVTGAEVFDVYRGGQVGEGRVSLALHLAFRASGSHPHRGGRDPGAGEDRRGPRHRARRGAARA